MSESQNIEWKQRWHDDCLKWICGFANAIGGVIYIGKDDDGNLVGLPDYKTLLENIPQKICNTMGIICDIDLKEKEGKKFIEIKVNPYSVPVSLRGRYYYRTGSTKMELTGVELNEFLLKKAGKTWDDIIEEKATINDIDENSIKQFIADSKEKGRLPDTAGLTPLQVLDKLRLVEKTKLKRASLILFGKDPSRFFPNILAKIGRFGKDGSDLKFQEVIEGNLVHLLNEVQVQLNYKFLTRPVSFAGMHRIEKDEYPVAALREMLLNALVHRTYMGASIQIRVYESKLSIWNEGILPQGLDIASLKGDHNSRPRNPKIADACFKAGYIDAWGRGTLKIIHSCEEAGLPEPEIIEKDGGVQVTIYKAKKINRSERIEKEFEKKFENISRRFREEIEKNLGIIRKEFGKNSERILEVLGKEVLAVYEVICKKPRSSAKEIAVIVNKSSRTVEKYIAQLKNERFIKRKGPKLGGHWEIIDKE